MCCALNSFSWIHTDFSIIIIIIIILKAAAAALARHDNGMQYASEVGVNSYVRVQLSFLKKEVCETYIAHLLLRLRSWPPSS